MVYYCNRRTKQCSNCGHRYTKNEYELWECPECGHDRHCKSIVSNEGDACKFHGGMSLRGIEHPRFIHGRYSRYIPSNLAESYKKFRTDENRVSVEEELDLARMLLADQIAGIGDGASGKNWVKARELFEKALRYNRQNRSEDFVRTLTELGEVLEKGSNEVGRAKDALDIMEQVRRLVNTERQIKVDEAEYITRAYALFMFGKILDAIERNVLPLQGGKNAVAKLADTVGEVVGTMGSKSFRPD